MKTILLVTACYDEPHRTMGSAPKIARQLAKNNKVVVFSGGSSDRVEQRSENLTIHFVKEWLIPDPVNNSIVPRMKHKLKDVLEQYDIDAVLNLKYMFYMNLCGPWLKKKGYQVVTATDAFPGYSWFSKSSLVNVVMWLYTRTLGKRVLTRSDHVILFHEALEADAQRLGLDYSVIPNGVEPEVMKRAKKKQLAGKHNILFVSRLESVKGYETVVEAMQQLTSEREDTHFYHVGHDGGNTKYVQEHTSDQMHFEGRKSLEDVYGYMKAADAIVLASKSEGLPNALMEGMYAGCVPVSTPVGAAPMLMEHGEIGRLSPYGDAEALQQSVQWVLDNPDERERMSKQAKRKMREEYSWDELRGQYEEILLG